MIGVLHGYSLEGSGSNIWTRCMIQALCEEGDVVHLVCQEKSPEKYDFIAEAYYYDAAANAQKLFARDVPYSGRCIFHRPQLGKVLPVYVGRFLESNPPMLPMTELPEDTIREYIDQNYRIVREIIRKQDISIVHVNHAILMSVVAQQLQEEQSLPYAVLPHGSEIEYVIRKDNRFLDLAAEALRKAAVIFVLSRELQDRMLQVFSGVAGIADKIVHVNLGVDTTLFEACPHHLRGSAIQKLVEAVSLIPRGKKPGMTEKMLAGLNEEISISRITQLLDAARLYAGRQPDQDLEEKLSRVEWQNETIILYVGRLISGKGIQLLIASLPLIFEAHPSAKVLITGHGPLREGMELFLWALQNGNAYLVEKLIQWGTLLEGGEVKPFSHILRFYETLRVQGKLQLYFETAQRVLYPNRVIFTGYLKHQELRYLFSSSDVAVFPSIIPESGPLVFLEALASGCFPIATYFGGAALHIDNVTDHLNSSDAEFMKIRPEESSIVAEIIHQVSAAIQLQGKYQTKLREIAIEKFDWRNVAQEWKWELLRLSHS
jgi:glycosyltransferase involved in cell wall biosynthesis